MTSIYGAKSNEIISIKEDIKDLPLEDYVRVGVGEDWKDFENEIRALGPNIKIRSDSLVEDKGLQSWAGLFRTESYYKNSRSLSELVERVLNSVTEPNVIDYSKIHNHEGEIPMALFFMKDSESVNNCSMTRHPNNPDIIYIETQTSLSMVPEKSPGLFMYSEKTNQFFDIEDNYRCEREVELNSRTLVDVKDMEKAIEFYKRIENLPRYKNSGFVYQMEFGTDPFSIFQWRAFRKKENVSWRLPKRYLKDFVYSSNFVIGTTKERGIVFSKDEYKAVERNNDFDLEYPDLKCVIMGRAFFFQTHSEFRGFQNIPLVISINEPFHKPINDAEKIKVYIDGIKGYLKILK